MKISIIKEKKYIELLRKIKNAIKFDFKKNKIFPIKSNKLRVDNSRMHIRRRKVINDKKNIRFPKIQIKYSYYVLLFAMVTLGIISVTITLKSYKKYIAEDYSSYASSSVENTGAILDTTIDKNKLTQPKLEQESVTVSSKIDNTNTIKTETSTTKTTVSVPTKVTNAVLPLKFIKPLNGDTIKPYSINEVIYSKTLELYKTHDGIDIAGNIGTEVRASERGTVEKIYEDSFYGNTIIIDHGQGYKTMYSNLDEKVNVKVKQIVKKNDVIGKVGKTAIGEYMDEAHIHFTIYKDSKTIDPISKFYE